MFSVLKKIIVSCILMAHCSLYTASADTREYTIAPEQVMRFLSTSAEGAFQLKTAYAHETTVSLFIHSEEKRLSTVEAFHTFSDTLLKKTLRNIADKRSPLTPEDLLEVEQRFDFSKYKMSCLWLATDGNEIAVQAQTKLFTPEPWSTTQYHQLSDKNIRIAFSTNALSADPTLQITEDAQADFDLVPNAPEKIVIDKDNSAINLLFNPTKWRENTDFRPFIKPVSYPILCSESVRGFILGASIGVVLSQLSEPYIRYIPDQNKNILRYLLGVAASVLGAAAAGGDGRAYDRFYTNEKKISKYTLCRAVPLSMSIFRAATGCHPRTSELRRFDDLYRALRTKLDNGEPYEEYKELERRCDSFLSEWRTVDPEASLYIPVYKTRRLHNLFYGQAIEDAKRYRAAGGFVAGVSFSMLSLAMLQISIIAQLAHI